MVYALFVLGFVFVLMGADLLVKGGARLARRLGVSELAVGLTVISMGTSLPELVVNLIASGQGSSELAIGNVLGSNVANVLLILGIASLVRELRIRDSTLLSEIPFSLAATLLVGFLANAALFGSRELSISRQDGAILIWFFAMFLAYVARVAKHAPGVGDIGPRGAVPAREIARVIAGAAALAVGGRWVVNGALAASQLLGLSETFIGLTVVAVGTSVPELGAVAVAAYRSKADMAVGTVVGSNIFNLLWVLGLSASVRPLPFDVVTNADILMIIFSSTLLLLAVIIGKPNTIERWEGATFLLVYAGYIRFLVLRG